MTGLYLVLWGKSKDESPNTESKEQETATRVQELGMTKQKVGPLNENFVAVDVN